MAGRAAAQNEEEAIMRNRNLHHHSFANFGQLAKSFTQYAEDIRNGKMQQAAESLKKLSHEISTVDAARRKLAAICDLNVKEQERYMEKLANCQLSFDQALQDIAAKKKELQDARIDRQHQEEYEVLCHQIMDHPQRADTQKEIESLMADIKNITSQSQHYQQHLELKKKQFAMLLHAIQDLQGLTDDTNDANEDGQVDAMQE